MYFISSQSLRVFFFFNIVLLRGNFFNVEYCLVQEESHHLNKFYSFTFSNGQSIHQFERLTVVMFKLELTSDGGFRRGKSQSASIIRGCSNIGSLQVVCFVVSVAFYQHN